MGNKYIVGDLYVNDSKVITEDTLPESSNFSGSYNDLTDKPDIPTIPTNVSAFTNDSKYVTEDAIIGPYSEGLAYTLTNGEYWVSGIGSCTDTDIVIPPIYNGKRVTYIGYSAFKDCTSLTSITIPDSVTIIGQNAFCNCTSLTSVTIPDGVRGIGWGAFQGCSSLTSITIPNSVTSIGSYAFERCSSLTGVAIPNSVTSIGTDAFVSCSSLNWVTIPNSVSSIDDRAFGLICDSLTIYCEAKSQPEGWHANWNYDNRRPVVWGAALDFASVNKELANYATTDYVDNVAIELDTTLTQPNKAADAKTVGDAFTDINNAIANVNNTLADIGSIIDVIELPTENIDERSIYRVSERLEAEVYFSEGSGAVTIAELLYSEQIVPTIITQVVDTLPETLTQSTVETGGTVYLYVVRSTGVVYGDVGAGVVTVGQVLLQVEGYDKGWSVDANTETEPGIYAVITNRGTSTYHIYNGNKWSKLIDETAGVSGGLSIKKIEFTDRPSLYAWLQNNLDKLVKSSMNTNQFPAPVNFTQVMAELNLDTNIVHYAFQQLHGWFSSWGEIELNVFKITENQVEQRVGQVRGDNNYTTNIIPDEYWTELNVSVTIYYIE